MLPGLQPRPELLLLRLVGLGELIALFGDGGNVEPDSAEGVLNNPEAAKISSESKIYVSDLKNDRVQVFDLEGKFLFSWGKTGSGPGEFKAPAGLAIDKNDSCWSYRPMPRRKGRLGVPTVPAVP